MNHQWKHKVGSIFIVSLLLVWTGCGSDDTSQQHHEEQGAVAGTVTLEGADDYSDVEVAAGEQTAVTDVDGTYRIDEIDAGGEVDVTAQIDGYLPQTQTADVEAGETTDVDFELELENQPPVIDSIVVDPDVLLPTENASITVDAHDPDETALSYDYEATNGFDVDVGEEPSQATLIAPGDFGVEAELTVTVEDEAGARDSQTVSIETRTNDDPVIESISAIPETLNPGETGTLSVVASDPDGDDTYYQWDAPEDWELVSDDEDEVEIIAPSEPGETAVVEVIVTDGLGGEATGDVEVSTSENQPPEINSIDVSPAQADPGGEIELSVDATDPEGDELSYAWSAPDGWTMENEDTAEMTLTAPESYGETAQIEITVEDIQGATATADVVVSTIENQGPQISSVTATPSQIERDGVVALEASASHPQGDELTYDWDVPDDWALVDDPAAPHSPELEAPDVAGETASVTVTVTDPNGLEAVASVVVSTLANQAPVIDALTVNPSSVIPGEMVTLDVSAYDPDGDDLTYSWTIPDGWSGSSSSEELELVAPDDYGVSDTVQVSISDGEDTTTASVTISTVNNVDPTISSLTADPQVVEPGATSALQVDASDPFGADLSYDWSVDDGDWMLSESGDEATVEAPNTPDAAVTVTVTVDDGSGGTATASTSVQTKTNQNPVIAAVNSDSPDWVERGGTAQLSADATDPDGGDLSYEWSASDGWTIDGDGADVELQAPSGNRVPGVVTLTVTDEFGGSDSEFLDVRTRDTQPDAFGFEDLVDVAPDAWIVSNAVVVEGFDGALTATCSNCEVSRNGGAFDDTNDEVESGDTIEIRVNSGDLEETVTADVQLGETESDIWSVTTTDWTGIRTFTTCSQSGRFGPEQSDCDDDYQDTTLESEVTVDEGFQTWEVPETRTYTLTAYGAGAEDTDSDDYDGSVHSSGRGAIIEADIELVEGQQIELVVGHEGTAHTDSGVYDGVGGGGASVVVDSSGEPLVIAGGGGGAGSSHGGLDGSTGTEGGAGSPECDTSPAGGNDGEGGTAGSEGGGGGGLLTDGEDSNGGGGAAFVNGAIGGEEFRNSDFGGFGGGAGGYDSGGGGGGYSGGGGGEWSDCSDRGGGAGGGGSFITDAAVDAATSDGSFEDASSANDGYNGSVADLDDYNEGQGMITIDFP